ncbi:MAG: putative bifunctional diguanylate cyclase/phosphodiesterase [Sphingorhabdus sp.]
MSDRTVPLSAKIAPARDAQLWLSAFEASATRSATLMLVGIRDLKQINDLHGREAGNAVIAEVGQRIVRSAAGITGAVMVARMPGREFLLIIGHSTETGIVETIVRRLLTSVSGNVGGKGQEIHISARIGVARARMGQGGEALLQQARAALSQAYGRKGSKFAVAQSDPGVDPETTAALDRSLRAAIAEGQIAILLQPQFSVADGRLVGAEALARWQHPDFGEVGADQLFAAADRCDLREELSHLIQQQAIGIAAGWPTALDDLRLSINLGAEELGEGYSERLLTLLQTANLPPERLTLELTEESLVRDIDLASQQLERLRQRNIRIAVDDFGTGYSSLAYLKTLPLDYLKIDKAMTPDIAGQGKDRIILRAIIAMAKALGLQIIAEGVEREAELERLRAEGCDYFQGYLRSEPLAPSAFIDFALRAN